MSNAATHYTDAQMLEYSAWASNPHAQMRGTLAEGNVEVCLRSGRWVDLRERA